MVFSVGLLSIIVNLTGIEINPLTHHNLLSVDFTFCCLVHKALRNQKREEVVSLYSVRREDISFLRGETTLPFLAWKDNVSNKEIAQYLSNPPSFVICQERPAVWERNAVFVIDREVLASDDDLKSDMSHSKRLQTGIFGFSQKETGVKGVAMATI